MRELLRTCLLPFALSNLISHANCGDSGAAPGPSSSTAVDAVYTSNSPTSAFTSVTSALGNATCLSRTANYITHTLPQQCLRTDRVAANVTQNSTASGTQSLDAAVTTGSIESATSAEALASNITSLPSDSSSAAESSTSAAATPSAPAPEPEVESDSPLDNANFLSFEEWKKQNLAKSGQLPENVGQGRNLEGLRERPGINNALEAFGEEGEIDLDFSGFGAEPRSARETKESHTDVTAVDYSSNELTPALRSKDAGKTCKERTNYASFDCAANILKSNRECKSGSSVLVENKDSYMLNTCSASNKFFIVELCDNILIDTIVLANYEFFSSMFRHFRVSVSDRYPVKIDKWKDLGTFEARNVRDVQAFLVERPQIWARYLRIEFLSHYGSEYYCPVSLLRVHGTTMLEDYRHQEEVARGEHAEDQATLDVEVNATPALSQEPSTETDESSKEAVTAISSLEVSQNAVAESETSVRNDSLDTTDGSQTDAPAPTSAAPNTTLPFLTSDLPPLNDSTCALCATTTERANPSSSPAAEEALPVTKSSMTENTTGDSTVVSNVTGDTKPINDTVSSALSSPTTSSNATVNAANTTAGASPVHSSVNSTSTKMPLPLSTSVPAVNVNSSFAGPPLKTSLPESATKVQSASIESSRQAPPSSSHSTHLQPATQESFYKSVHKRLQQLESNSTLSLQYIEEQSRILRDAFSKVEKRQIAATTTFLSTLNSTVMTELQGFRQAYDQLWQSTVIELEGQREQYQREMLAMGTRLTLVAEELVWQKRMGIVQSTLLLLCLGLVLFARQGNGYLEMPLMQQMMHRSQAALSRAGWESPPVSPSPNSRSPVSLFRRKLWRSHTEPTSGNVTDATDSRPESKDGPEVVVAPPTPPLEAHDELDDDEPDEEQFEEVWESQSGPATPRGTREGSEFGEDVGWLDPGAVGSVT